MLHSFHEVVLRFFARLMDQGQQYATHGYEYSGLGTRSYKGDDILYEYRPYYLPERRDVYEHKLLVSSSAHTHLASPTRRPSLAWQVSHLQPGLGVSPLHDSYVATSPETSDETYAYSGNSSPQGIANGYAPASSAFQDIIHRKSRENGIPDLIQARGEPMSHLVQWYLNSIGSVGSNTDWTPDSSPTEQVPAAINDAPSALYPESRTNTDRIPVHHPDQRSEQLTTDWRGQGAKDDFSRSLEENVPSNRQLPTQDRKHTAPDNGRLNVPPLEEHRSRTFLRKSADANAPDGSLTVHADEDAANNDLTKKRKRKPRTIKPRKPRTLTEEGKAHAKAVRECPGGACVDCKRKKTKCTHKLLEDIPMDLHDKRTPNTPWTEPLTPDYGPEHYDPVFYRSSQENDFAYEDDD